MSDSPVVPKRKRGRPKAGEIPPEGWKPRKPPTVSLDDVERRKQRAAAAAAAMTRANWVRAQAARQEVTQEVVSADHPCLRYLNRADRLAWLCLQIHRSHVEERVVSLGPGLGYEVVDVATAAPNFKAMEMLMKAMNDYSDGTRVAVDARGAAGGDASPRVVLVVADNGRG